MDNSAISRSLNSIAGWLPTSTEESIFVWSHSNDIPSNSGVIIIGPIGPESLHCHRSIKCLAEELQGVGITALRYDHTGMGNSSSDLFHASILDEWLANIASLHNYLINDVGVEKVAIIALRSGALLAAKYLEAHTIDRLVLWYPYTQGAAFYRDISMIDGILETVGDEEDAYSNAGGYPLTNRTTEDLKSINLTKLKCQVEKSVFTIQSKESKAMDRLEEKFVKEGIAYNHLVMPSLPKMARMAQFSEVPVDDIKAIIQHLDLELQIIKSSVPEAASQKLMPYQSSVFIESVFTSNDTSRLFGVRCEPRNKSDNETEKPLILITNGGAAHHVGPNRLHTDLARELADNQFVSVRCDLSSLGDSPARYSDSNPNPYPAHAVDDIAHTLTLLKENDKFRKIVIIGLCSGAHNAFHAQLQLEQHNIVETILINPLTFYMREGDSTLVPESVSMEMNKNYYQDQARDFKVWLKLLKDPAKVVKLGIFVFKFFYKKLFQLLRPVLQMAGIVSPEPLQVDIEKILTRKQHLSFFISNNDPGHSMIMKQAGTSIRKGIRQGKVKITITSSVDHTFTTLESRRELIESITRHLSGKYA